MNESIIKREIGNYFPICQKWDKRGNVRMVKVISDSFKRMKLKEKALTVAAANA
jgi:hypothetical protein